MGKYIIHKAVEFDAVKVSARKAMGAESIRDLAGTYMAQRKYDGCNAVVIVTPNGEGDKVLSRTGEVVRSCAHLVRAVRNRVIRKLERGHAVAVLGEVWRAGVPQATISGEFRRHEPAAGLRLAVFDMLTLGEFEAGYSPYAYTDRFDVLYPYFREDDMGSVFLAGTYNPGTYGDPADLASYFSKLGGYDGLILRDPHGTWKAGSGTDGEIIKVKPTLTLDLRVTGVEEGKGKYKGTLGALVCQGPKGLVKVSGMSDEQRDEWWNGEGPKGDSLIYGKIIEVECLGITEAGSLREPRFKGVRHDKEHADFE
ncbi:hypothetical protein CAL26_21150 [Bordetella genomosp. 9]|uniref:DNA ligase OB-like domain-containing protein n=1 Tax=Bordetella genomosp. 9 TaxID=1416803 RepID=A0A261R4W5_9BORD|nr:hypothetical protein [Bordetella genomosp. 9]OZI20064.1 hypothetical protein CAL26_21150 [Bordetella genomosp. 9]